MGSVTYNLNDEVLQPEFTLRDNNAPLSHGVIPSTIEAMLTPNTTVTVTSTINANALPFDSVSFDSLSNKSTAVNNENDNDTCVEFLKDGDCSSNQHSTSMNSHSSRPTPLKIIDTNRGSKSPNEVGNQTGFKLQRSSTSVAGASAGLISCGPFVTPFNSPLTTPIAIRATSAQTTQSSSNTPTQSMSPFIPTHNSFTNMYTSTLTQSSSSIPKSRFPCHRRLFRSISHDLQRDALAEATLDRDISTSVNTSSPSVSLSSFVKSAPSMPVSAMFPSFSPSPSSSRFVNSPLSTSSSSAFPSPLISPPVSPIPHIHQRSMSASPFVFHHNSARTPSPLSDYSPMFSVTPDSATIPYFPSESTLSTSSKRVLDSKAFSPALPDGYELKLPIIGYTDEGAPLITSGTFASLLLSCSEQMKDPPVGNLTESPLPVPIRSCSASPPVSESPVSMQPAVPSDGLDAKTPSLLNFSQLYDRMYILDCRFLFEYEGGHLPGARNITSFQQVVDLLLPSISSSFSSKSFDECVMNSDIPEMESRVLLIFHCEFSQSRGPDYFSRFRELDRTLHTYPKLTYPETYVLYGGYNAFYTAFPKLCGDGYVRMTDHRWIQECTEAMKQRKEEKRTTHVDRKRRKDGALQRVFSTSKVRRTSSAAIFISK